MRYIIYGAGAIGGAVGAKLFLNDVDVVLIARGDHLTAIQRDGLRLKIPDETLTVPVPAVGAPAELEIRHGDVVVLTMKSQDTEAALDDLRLVADDDLPIVSCQNGVENERIALRRFAHVYGMFVFMPAWHLEPGLVEVGAWPKSAVLDVGCYPSGVDHLAAAIAHDFDRSGLVSRPEPDIMRWKYGKMHQNMVNAIQAVCGVSTEFRDLTQRCQQELEACFAAAGVDWVRHAEVRERTAVARGARTANPADSAKGHSSWQSLARGTGSIEADYLNGEVALLGRLHGVPTPVNDLFQLYAHRLARQRRPPGSVPLEEMRAALARLESLPAAPPA